MTKQELTRLAVQLAAGYAAGGQAAFDQWGAEAIVKEVLLIEKAATRAIKNKQTNQTIRREVLAV